MNLRGTLQRGALVTGQGVLAPVWRLAYRVVARLTARYLARGRADATVYARAGVGQGEVVPGLSDIDLVVVVDRNDDHGSRVRNRHHRLVRLLPPLRGLVDLPAVYADDELRTLARVTYSTYGLTDGSAAYAVQTGPSDRIRLLQRPALYGDFSDWSLLQGLDRRPEATPQTPQARREAAWLELAFWWWQALSLAREPGRADAAYLCVKLVAEPARAWLWLTRGERLASREHVLTRAAALLPDQAESLRRHADLRRGLASTRTPPLADTFATLTRLSAEIADEVTRQAFAEGVTEVRLLGTRPGDLLPPICLRGGHEHAGPRPDGLPLCDWRALVTPTHADETLTWAPEDPASPEALAAAGTGPGAFSALGRGSFALIPITHADRALPRRIACPATDPVSFALRDGAQAALYPDVAGWSFRDTTQRAVNEHRARLARTGLRAHEPRAAIASLLVAARAALAHASEHSEEPTLTVTLRATAERLSEQAPDAGVLLQDAVATLRGERDGADVVSPLDDLVRSLPSLAE